MCGFNKMGPPRTPPEPHWLLCEPCSLIASFHDVVMFLGLLVRPTFQCTIFSVRLLQVTCIRRKATNIRRTEGRHSQANRNVLGFKLSPCSLSSVLAYGRFPGVWFILADVSEHSICSIFEADDYFQITQKLAHQIGMVNQELLETVDANFRKRLQMFILQNGNHLSDIIFRT
jgi:hypothetical protein